MYLDSNMEKLKRRKKELGWTNQELARKAGIPLGTVNKIFSGATRYPRKETIDALVKALGLDYYKMEDYGAGVSIIRETAEFQAKKEERDTLDTYYALPQDTRAELIDGEIYYMSAPSANHQIILGELSYTLQAYLKKNGSSCRLFFGPYDVCLDNDNYTMVQPDLMIICDSEKYKGGVRCNGAPDFIIEIISPSNPRHDYFRKLQKYENAGVKEYWIVDPLKMRVLVYAFAEETVPVIHTFEDKVESVLYPGMAVDFTQIRDMLLQTE